MTHSTNKQIFQQLCWGQEFPYGQTENPTLRALQDSWHMHSGVVESLDQWQLSNVLQCPSVPHKPLDGNEPSRSSLTYWACSRPSHQLEEMAEPKVPIDPYLTLSMYLPTLPWPLFGPCDASWGSSESRFLQKPWEPKMKSVFASFLIPSFQGSAISCFPVNLGF